MNNDNKLQVLQMMANLELLVGELYKTYAEMFPDYAYFWSDLAKEEEHHATLISSLSLSEKESTIYFRDGRFDQCHIKRRP